MALQSFLSFAHCRAASAVVPLLPKATFTPSIQPNLSLPRTRLLNPSHLTVLIHSLLVSKPSQYSKIHSTRQLPFYPSSSTHLFIPNFIHSPQHSLYKHNRQSAVTFDVSRCVLTCRRWYRSLSTDLETLLMSGTQPADVVMPAEVN